MKKILLAISLALFSTLAMAHPGHAEHGALAGFLHPLTGIDHLLVMVAIGMWAAKLGGSTRWQLPVTFVLVMALGAAIAMSGLMPASLNADSVEIGVSASVLAMGLLLLIQLPRPIQFSLLRPLQIALTAIFAMLHGFAHGLELSLSSGWSVMLGMLLATALLHAIGLLLSSGRVTIARQVNVVMGGLMLLAGAYLLAV